jgi:predicted alpha/beta superfamily hydrolase
MPLLRKAILLLLLSLAFSLARAQPEPFRIGDKATLSSKILGEKREVWVHVPRNLAKAKTTQRFPVVYVLDGDQHFHSLSGLVHQLSATNGNTLCPEMIVVAILNTDRTRDLTITHDTAGFAVDPGFARNSGGAEKFTSFLEQELFPFIDAQYPTAPYRTLVGHSLGGMLVVNTLLNHPQLFDAYVALDPSLWWDEQLLVKQAPARLKEKRFDGKTFYLAVANALNSPEDTAALRKETNDYNVLLNSQLDFADLLAAHPGNGLRWRHAYFKEESHTTVPLMGEYHALRFIFDFHPFKALDRLFDPGFDADSALTAHYQMISQRMGYKVMPPEEFLDGLGHAYLESALLDKAEGVLGLNLQNYPQSPGVYVGMGDWCVGKGDAKAALSYYRQALRLKKDPEIEKKISRLNQKI